MHPTRSEIIASSEQVFDRNGFAASGMDTLTEAAGVSSRTLYKHVGSKAGLTLAVLESRMHRFFNACTASTIEELFDDLETWIETEGARGCLFLRAQAESTAAHPEVLSIVNEYRNRLRELIDGLVAVELGHADETITDALLVVFEGATSVASYLGPRAVAAARTAANALLTKGTPCT